MATATNPGDRSPTLGQLARARLTRGLPQQEFVSRTALLARLNGVRGRPLVVVTAPAGYGKTTLLRQWAEKDDRPFAWLTLEEADGEPELLADSIAIALARIGISWSADGSAAASAAPEQSFVLVIDDAHLVPRGVLAGAALGALDWLPAGTQLVLASRSQPELPLGRMRAQRMTLEIGARELAMSDAEAALLLAKAGLECEFTAVSELVRRTEGWPVALELAAISYALRPDSSTRLEDIAGDDHLISEYLRGEVLAPLSPAKIRFLTRCSVLDWLSGPLCDAALARKRSGEMLAKLARANVPVEAVDASHESYRLHPLFREMLQTELRRGEPQVREALHRRAAVWYRSVGDFDRAIEHASEAGEFHLAGELLWGNLLGYLGEGRNDEVQRWLSRLTAEQVAGCAPLALAAAHSHLALGTIHAAEQWGRSATVALSLDVAGADGPDRAGALIIEAWAARAGAIRMGADAARAYELLPGDSPWRATCCLLAGTASLLAGDLSGAERQLAEGAARGVLLAPGAASLCLAQLAVIATEHEDTELAADFAQRASAVVDQHRLGGYPSSALVFAVSAATAARGGAVDEAKTVAARCVDLIGGLDEAACWYGSEARILLSRVSLALGDFAGARELLADASRLARRTPDVVIFQQWFDDSWGQFDARAEAALVGLASLTTAELRVLRFLPTHYSFHEIAERLHVSANTVKTHVHAVYRKLDASSRSEAVAQATRAGLLGG